jgi:hypothetical protein
MSRAVALSIAAVIIGAGIGAGLVTAWTIEGSPDQCVASQPVDHLTILMPVLIVNSPYGGYANGSWTRYANTSSQTIKETDTIGARNGSIDYLLEQSNWTIWTTKQSGDRSVSCAGVFSYSWTPTGIQVVGSTGLNYTNDSQASQFTGGNGTRSNYGAPYDLLYFNDSFYRSSGGFSDCGGGTSTTAAASTYIDYRIPFDYQGSPQIASITFDELTNFTYTFPANGGAWEMDDLSSPGGPGGGLSFSFLRSCL